MEFTNVKWHTDLDGNNVAYKCTMNGQAEVYVPIDSGNVEEKVVRSPDVWLVEFQSPRCGSCQEMAPVWNEFASRNGKYVRLGQVSIDTDEGIELAQQFGIIEHGIPSIWAYDLVGAVEPTKIWADFETTELMPVPDAGHHQQNADAYRERRRHVHRGHQVERSFFRSASSSGTSRLMGSPITVAGSP